MKTRENIASPGLHEKKRPISPASARPGIHHKPAAPRMPRETQSERALTALQEAFRIVGPTLLDCMVELTIIVPEEWVLEVIHDLEDRRCVCRAQSIDTGYYIITAAIPLRQSFGYRERLEVLSQGTASFSMRLQSRPRSRSRSYPGIASSCGL